MSLESTDPAYFLSSLSIRKHWIRFSNCSLPSSWMEPRQLPEWSKTSSESTSHWVVDSLRGWQLEREWEGWQSMLVPIYIWRLCLVEKDPGSYESCRDTHLYPNINIKKIKIASISKEAMTAARNKPWKSWVQYLPIHTDSYPKMPVPQQCLQWWYVSSSPQIWPESWAKGRGWKEVDCEGHFSSHHIFNITQSNNSMFASYTIIIQKEYQPWFTSHLRKQGSHQTPTNTNPWKLCSYAVCWETFLSVFTQSFWTIPSRPVPTLQISPRTEPVFVVEQWVNKRFAGRARHGIQQLAIPVIHGWWMMVRYI